MLFLYVDSQTFLSEGLMPEESLALFLSLEQSHFADCYVFQRTLCLTLSKRKVAYPDGKLWDARYAFEEHARQALASSG